MAAGETEPQEVDAAGDDEGLLAAGVEEFFGDRLRRRDRDQGPTERAEQGHHPLDLTQAQQGGALSRDHSFQGLSSRSGEVNG